MKLGESKKEEREKRKEERGEKGEREGSRREQKREGERVKERVGQGVKDKGCKEGNNNHPPIIDTHCIFNRTTVKKI